MATRSSATARTTATSRSTATNRVVVRDMGTALRFDGVDDYVTTTIPIVGGDTYTFSCFIKPRLVAGADRIIFSQNQGGFMFGIDTAGFVNWTDTDLTKGTISFNFVIGEYMFLSWTTNLTTGTPDLY